MKIRYILISLLLLGTAVCSFAATPCTPGQTVTSDYVVVVNTNADYTKTQATGTLVFDSSNGVPTNAAIATIPGENSTPTVLPNTLSPAAVNTSYTVGTRKFIGNENMYVCIAVGEHCYVWMEEELKKEYDAAGKTATAAVEMVSVYEGKPYQMLNDLADGRIPYNDNAGKLSILLEITSGSSGFYAGESDITAIHINTPQADKYRVGSLENRNGLLVHEGQHALFNILSCGGDAFEANRFSWINEGLSVAAMDYTWGGSDPTGWLTRVNSDVDVRNGASIIYEDYRQTTALDYSLPYLFVRYLANRKAGRYAPMAFMKSIYKVSAKNKTTAQYLNDLLTYNGFAGASGTLTFAEALADFYVAAFAQEKYGNYGFNADATVWRQVTDYPVYMGQSGKSVNLVGGGALVLKTLNGQFTVPTNGGADIRYIACNKAKDILKPATGTGTVADPYIITNAAELAALTAYPAAHFALGNAINVANEVTYSVETFSGSLDGRGFTISGLQVPLISTSTGVLKNLKVAADFNGEYGNSTGVLVCYNQGFVADCSVSGTFSPHLTGTNFILYPSWGTLVGTNEVSGEILRCFSTAQATLTLPNNECYVGGLIGINQGKIMDCYTQGTLSVTQLSTEAKTLGVGGLVGHMKALAWGTTLGNSYSVTTLTTNVPSANVQKYIGRIVGKETNTPTITNTYGLTGVAMSGSNVAVTDAAARTETQLKTETTFVDWDFTAVWKLSVGSYPTFTDADDITSVTGHLYQDTYIVGTKFNVYGSTITVNETSILSMTEDMLDLSQFSTAAIGTQTIHGSYKGHNFTVQAAVVAPTSVSDLKIVVPGKTAYAEGEKYSSAGVQLSAKLNGASYAVTIVSGFTNDKPNALTTADKSVTFSYFTQTVSQPLTVSAKWATAITVVTSPAKKGYTAGDLLDLSDVKYQLTYSDGSKSGALTSESWAANDIHVAKYKDAVTTAFDVTTPLSGAENNADFYFYVGSLLPDEEGAVSAYITAITVSASMFLADTTFVFGIGLDEYPYTESIQGGSYSYQTTKKSGTLPPGMTTYSIPDNAGSDLFMFGGVPTTKGTYIVVYDIKDLVSNQTITVNLTFVVDNPSSETTFQSFVLKSVFNKVLAKDVIGVIDNEKGEIVLTVPQGTNISSLTPTYVSCNPNGTTPWNGTSFNFVTTNPVTYTIVAKDGVTSKTFKVYVRFEQPTFLNDLSVDGVSVYVVDDCLHVADIQIGTVVSVTDITGQLLLQTTAQNNHLTFDLPYNGIFVVRVGTQTIKVIR